MLLATVTKAQVAVTSTDRFITRDQMLLANKINESGDPHLPQAVAPDFRMIFESLRWNRSLMNKALNPGAMGQTLPLPLPFPFIILSPVHRHI